MVTLRTLLEVYKGQNPDFRHEFNGDSWNIWTTRDNNTGGYPDYQDISTEALEQLLIQLLKDKANSLRMEHERADRTAKQIENLLKDFKPIRTEFQRVDQRKDPRKR